MEDNQQIIKDVKQLLDLIQGKIALPKSSYTFLDAIGQSTRELTHSYFIANLLDPYANHGFGKIFSKYFIELLNEKLKEKKNHEKIELISPIISVEVEKSFGPEREKEGHAFGGRADIYLKDFHGNIIIIENKIFAGDQHRQIERYWNSIGKMGIVVYLTLNGKKPSQDSLGKAQEINLINLSYSDLVNCIKDCFHDTSNLELELILNQYISKINELKMEFDIQSEILKSSSNMRAAIAIQNNTTSARESATMKFMEALSFALKGGPVSKQNTFWWFKFGMFEICIEWNLYIRIKNEEIKNELFDKWISGDNVKWRYITLSDIQPINFHTFEGTAARWLDDPDSFISEVAKEIKEITQKI